VRAGAGDGLRFGTSGWRGILGDEVTFPRLRALVRAAGAWLAESSGDPSAARLLVGHDVRFASEALAAEAVAVLRAEGLAVAWSDRAVPTPVVTSAVRARRAAGALVLTASHNPPLYHGLKVFTAGGAALGDAAAREIEARARRAPTGPPPATPARRRPDLVAPYVKRLLRCLDREALAASGLRVAWDAMHGSAGPVVEAVLGPCGVRLEGLRSDPDPRFGGAAPDPLPERLPALRSRLRRGRGPRVGLACDGDGDRLCAVDERGRVLSATGTLALLVDHLARTGRARRGVAISVATGRLVERVAAEHGLTVERLPIGFKHLAGALASGRADVAGEESGGFAWSRAGLDKDGILAGCLLAERVAGAGRSLGEELAGLERRHGGSACGRRALPWSGALGDALQRLEAEPPEAVGGAAVREVCRRDGLRLVLDDGFLMWRGSGTEPVLRLYAEASGPRRLQERLDRGERLLARARRR